MADETALVAQKLRNYYRSGATRPYEWRKAQLQGLLSFIDENLSDIEKALMADLRKSAFNVQIMEVTVVADIKELLKNLKKLMQPRKAKTTMSDFPAQAEVRPEPYGVCLIIGPWNVPFALLIDPLAGALAAGNCALVKPSEITPATSSLMAKLLPKYLDNNAVQVVEGGAPVCTALLEQRWDYIFYTGGTAVGKIIMMAAAKNLTPVTLELGGKSPLIIDSTADLKVAAKRIAWGKFLNLGQVCIAPDYILAEETIAGPLTNELVKVLQEFYGEDPQKSEDLPRIVSDNHWNRLDKLLSEPGVADKIVFGGKRVKVDRWIEPTLLRDVSWDVALMQEEIFGPVLPIQSYKSLDEAIDIINSKPKPLALYPFSKDKAVVERLVNETSSGGVCVNDCIKQFIVKDLPFGGVGDSGLGAYHGKSTFETFSHMKSVLAKPWGADPPFLYPPYFPARRNILLALIQGKFFTAILYLLRIKK